MEMPKPGDAHKKLDALVGEWGGDEKLHPSPWDPAGGGALARVTNRRVADGFAVVQEYEQSRNGQVTFRGYGVFWFDPARDEYVMHWWDSMGSGANEYRGRFEGNVLRLSSPMPQGGRSRTSWTLTGPDAHEFLMEMSPDGQAWHPAMEGRYQRRAAAGGQSPASRSSRGQSPDTARLRGQSPSSRRKTAAKKAATRPVARKAKAARSSKTRKAAKKNRRK